MPANAIRTGDDFTENAILTFKCKESYDLVGGSQIRCKSDGQWTDRTPFCIGKAKRGIFCFRILEMERRLLLEPSDTYMEAVMNLQVIL